MVHPNTPFEVSGRVTDEGSPEPHFVDLVTVQVDSSPAVKAALHRIHDQTQSLVAFSAFVSVTGGQDPHTLTVTAKDDRGFTVTVTRRIFTVVAFKVDAPAVVIDVLSFVPFNEPVVLG